LNAINPKKNKTIEMEEECYPVKQHLLPFRFNENAIQLIEKTTEDNDDYILFYAEGLDTYNVESPHQSL
jgi:hypothetical protein